MKRAFSPIKLDNIKLTGGLLKERQDINIEVTVPHIYEELEATGRIKSLECKWREGDPNRPLPFGDSDIGKTIEAISYSLKSKRDSALESGVDRIVDLLALEQYPDGYLNTYYRTYEVQNRWTNLYYMHELYCAGHLIEGAVAYFEATGKRGFLDIMCKYADHICEKFGPEEGKIHGYDGHPEIELALVKLYKTTEEEKYLKLSRYFIDERGKQPYFFEVESLKRGVDTTVTANQKRHLKYFLKSRGPYAEYQAHKPVREQTEPVGHAVRAMYLYSGMADIADAYDDDELYAACGRIWDSLVNSQFYITGGIGPSSDGERFTFAYDLPNENTYNESCASVALILWANRMLQFECDGKYADIMEQTLYNTVLASVSLGGDEFFYANYLSVLPEKFHHASASTIDKMTAHRQKWFDVACCPPNVARLIGSLGSYMYSTGENKLYVHLYSGNVIHFTANNIPARLTMETDYPWNDNIHMSVDFDEAQRFTLGFRIPRWCPNWKIKVDGLEPHYELHKGYCTINKQWHHNTIELEFAMPVLRIEANPKVRQDCGRIALQRGPLVYCIEEADNGKGINDISIDSSCEIEEVGGVQGLPKDVVALKLDAFRRQGTDWPDALYRPLSDTQKSISAIAVPYYLWGNRGFGEMLVWMLKK